MTPTRKSVPGAGSEAGGMMSLSEMNAVVHEAKDKILALIAERDALLEALLMTQFGFNHVRCPVCAGFEKDSRGERDHHHNKSCPVDAAIRAAFSHGCART